MAHFSPGTVNLVQTSWALVMPISDAAASLFYDRLFALDPTIRPLFKSDMSEQKKKLMQTLNVAVGGLNDVEKLVPVLEQLGARHAGYMVREQHYDLVGQALLWTLQEGLGDAFTPAVATAWTEVYGIVSSVMVQAMRRAGATAASADSIATVAPPRSTPNHPTMSLPLPVATTIGSAQPAAPAPVPSQPLRGASSSSQAAPSAATPSALRVEIDSSVTDAIVEALRARPSAERVGPSMWGPRPSEPRPVVSQPVPKTAWFASSALVGGLAGVVIGAAMGPSDASALVRSAPVVVALSLVWAAGIWFGRHLGASR
jgi:hemoglobin-like flavoprotein